MLLSVYLLTIPTGAFVAHPGSRLLCPTPASTSTPCVMMARSRRAERRAARQKKGETPPSTDRQGLEPAVPEAFSFPEDRTQESDLSASFVQDKVGVTLPSLDDFRRREEADESSGRRRRSPQGVEWSPSQVDETAPAAPTAQDKIFELLTFDKIDDRVERSDEAPYDMTARLIGRGVASQGGAYLLPYFQSGHILLLLVLLLSSTISYPGFPLTQVPDEYRELLREGLLINYAVNAVCAVYSRGIAAAKQEPVNFWFGKILLLGGLALGELTQAVPDVPKAKTRR